MKKHPGIKEIYHRFLRNEATAAEIDQLFNYFEAVDELALRKLIAMDAAEDLVIDHANEQRAAHLAGLQAKINAKIDHIAEAETVGGFKKHNLTRYFNSTTYKVAASFLLVAFLSFFLYSYLKPLTADEIKPAGNYATLLTTDGKQVNLRTSKHTTIGKIQGVTIQKTADGQIIYTASGDQKQVALIWNSIVTPLGGKYRIVLSDGSKVVLNSGSKLEFPVGFHGIDRRVKLTGEAYFEVKKDPSKPFIVVSGEAITEVLGTKFNVSSYPEDGEVRTTLLEGKVRFSRNETQTSEILKPGDQAVLKGQDIQVLSVHPEDFMAWKDNRFVFKNEKLSIIMLQLSRWYNVDVDYHSLPDRRLYANMSADVNLSEVLRMLSLTSDIKFSVDGRRVSVMK
jgi:transmembrane sensor